MLTILLSFLASPVLAGNVEECEALKGNASPGLYGLCIAYHNADSARAQERILNNYDKKAGPNDPPMPGTGDSVPCACWTVEQMAAAIDFAPAFECRTSFDPEFAVYSPTGLPVVTFLVESNSCFYIGPDAILGVSPLDPDVEQACRDGIQALVDMDFGSSCP